MQRLSEFEKERERARLHDFLSVCPREILTFFRVADVLRYLKIKLDIGYATTLVRKYQKMQESEMSTEQANRVDKQTALENIAAILTKTYSYCGQNESIAPEDALTQIGRELKHVDPTILQRNEKKRPKERKPLL